MTRALLWLWVLAVLAIGLPRVALAGPIEARAASGTLPVELVQKGGSFSGKLVVENRGPRAASVTLVPREGGPTDPRLPPGLKLKFENANDSVLLDPGQKREAEIDLTPVKGRRFHEVYGHVLVQTEGSTEAVVGFHAALGAADSGPSGRLLSMLWAVPLVAALAAFLLRGRSPRPGLGRALWVGALGIQVALLAWAVSRFDVLHSRFDGNEGVQLVERAALLRGLGVEYHLGVDGSTLVLCLAAALIGLFAALLAEDAHAERHAGFALLVASGTVGAFCSLDLALMLAFWLLALVAACLALWLWAGDAKLARGAALTLGLGFALVAFAVWQLSATATPGYLLDGTRAARVFSLTELAHGGFVPKNALLFGAHPVKVVYTCLFLGAALTLAVAPFGGWLSATLVRAPASLALVLGGTLTLLGAHALWRIGYAALPDGARWAELAVAVFGVLATVVASLLALSADDPRRFAAHAVSAAGGAVLVGCASLTAVGLQGALLLALGRGLALASLLGVLAMVSQKGTRIAPIALALGAVAWTGAGLGPGTLAFTGALASVYGALPRLGWPAIAECFALVLLTGAAVRSYRRTFQGPSEGPEGVAPLPGERDVSVVLAAALLLLVLGFWPRPLLRLIDTSTLDQAEQVNPPGALEIVRREAPSEAVAAR